MADIELVIKMPEERYRHIMRMQFYTPRDSLIEEMLTTIRNGTTLPKGHGKLKDADSILATAWTNFYKHEDEWEKKDPDYLPFGRMYGQNGFECCQQTIVNAPTIIESDTESE